MKGRKGPIKISYGMVVGIILFAAFIAVSFGLAIRHNQESAKQSMQSEQINEVSGEVSTAKEEQTEYTEEKSEADTEAEKEEASAKVNTGYNGEEKLEWPLLGNVIIPYSMDTTVYFETLDQYQCNAGLFIQAAEDTKVKNVYSGTVKEIKQDDKYGTVVTVDMGGDYSAKYAQMQNLKVKTGDKVKTGEVIGTVSKPTDFFSLEGSHLYFEVQKKGEPINPADILE